LAKLSASEQETIIRLDEESPVAEVYTASRRVAERLVKGGVSPARREGESWWFVVPKQALRLKPGRRSIYLGGRGSGGA
jgi:hypothetical protein